MNRDRAQLRRQKLVAAMCAGLLGATAGGHGQEFSPPKPAKYGLVAAEPTASPAPIANPEAVALAPGLSLESRRYLLYLYARLNDPAMAEALAARILQDNSRDQQTLQVLASMYVERKDVNKSLKTARQLVDFYPNDDQSHYFLGAAYSLAGRYADAEEVLRKLKLKQFKGKLYPYETDLAAAALKAGDWYKAMLAYQELLRHHQLSEPLRLEARKIIEGIYRQHLPQLAVDGRAILLKSGQMYRTWAEYREHVTDRHMGFLRLSRSDVEIKGQLDYRPRWSDNHDALAGLDSSWTRRYQTSAWAGGGDHGAMGGAKLTRSSGEQRFFELELQANERASDGLLIESLNGRQHRLSLNGNWLFTPNWLGYFQAGGREVVLSNDRLGRGYSLSGNLERVIFRDGPEIRAGYRVIWMEFDRSADDPELVAQAAPAGATLAQKQALLENTILGKLHRQGAYLSYRDQLSGWVYHQTTVGSDYSVDRGGFEYYVTTGLRIYPRKSLEMRVELGYTTSARTADQDSDQWQLSAGLTFWF